MSELRINNITDRAGSSGPIIAGVSTVTSTSHMVMPSGPTEMRGGRGRGVTAGGTTPSNTDAMEFFEIATTGNAQDFGDLSRQKRGMGGCSSATRGIIMGGYYPSPAAYFAEIEYVIISSQGGGNDFGDMNFISGWGGSCSNNTRGLHAGSWNSLVNNIDFITIATTGDGTNFGDLTAGRQVTGSTSSPTRGIWFGGASPTPNPNYPMNIIDFVTIASQGDAQDFGDVNAHDVGGYAWGGCSNGTRGVFYGGKPNPSSQTNAIDFITIATKGNAQDFGDAVNAVSYPTGSMASNDRGVWAGGGGTNVIQFVTISSTGNAQDFGDLLSNNQQQAGFSDADGGLGD